MMHTVLHIFGMVATGYIVLVICFLAFVAVGVIDHLIRHGRPMQRPRPTWHRWE